MQKLKEERKKNIKIRLQCDMDAGTIRKVLKLLSWVFSEL